MSTLRDAKLEVLLWSLQGAIEANEGGDAGQIERQFKAAVYSALARAVDLLPQQRAALELVSEAVQRSQLGIPEVVVLRDVVARINAQDSPVDVDWVRSTLATQGLIAASGAPFDVSMLERAYAMVMPAARPLRDLLLPLLHRSASDMRLFALVEQLVTDRYFAHVLSGGVAADPFSLEELEGPIEPVAKVKPRPARHARLSGASARILFAETPPPATLVPILEGKRWLAAFQELISVHDGLIDEARDLRDLLGQAKEHIERQLRRGEQGMPVDAGHLQAFLDRLEAEGE